MPHTIIFFVVSALASTVKISLRIKHMNTTYFLAGLGSTIT